MSMGSGYVVILQGYVQQNTIFRRRSYLAKFGVILNIEKEIKRDSCAPLPPFKLNVLKLNFLTELQDLKIIFIRIWGKVC